MSRVLWFVLGIVFGIAALFVGGYLFVRGGGVPMGTTAKPLPLEKTVAGMALRASYGPSASRKNPLPFSEQNMLEGAMAYADHCAVCHGAPGKPRTAISQGMFPDPPGLFEGRQPEFFARGYEGRPPQLCYTSPQLVAQVVKDARAKLDAGADYVQLVPMDNDQQCRCANCQAPLDKENQSRQFASGKADFALRQGEPVSCMRHEDANGAGQEVGQEDG